MQIVIDLDGNRYVGRVETQLAETFIEELYDNMEDTSKLMVHLIDGGVLILGKEAVQSAAIKIYESEQPYGKVVEMPGTKNIFSWPFKKGDQK